MGEALNSCVNKPIITLDTSSIIDLYNDDKNLKKLKGWHEMGYIEIVKTDVVDTELTKTSLGKSAEFREDIGNAVLDHSRLDHCKLSDKPSELTPIFEVLFPETKWEQATRNQIRDAMHLSTHSEYGRDYFVTKDKHMYIDKKGELEVKFGITVLAPEECVEELKRKMNLV